MTKNEEKIGTLKKLKILAQFKFKFWIFGLILTAIVYLFQYTFIPYSFSKSAQEWAKSAGINLTIDDWSVNWFDTSISAENLRVFTPRRIGIGVKETVLEAPEITLEFSLVRLFMVSSWQDIKWGAAINELYIRNPQLYLYKPLHGEWNFKRIINRQKFLRFIELFPTIENSPAGSNATLVHTKQENNIFRENFPVR